MSSLRNLSEKTLTMEDPRLTFRLDDQSQEMLVSSEEDISDLEKINSRAKKQKKAKISLSKQLRIKRKF